MFENEKALFAYASGSVQDTARSIPTDVSIAEPGRDSRWPFAVSFSPAWLALTAGVALILLFAWVAFRNLSETSVPSQQTKVKDHITPNSAMTPTVAPQSPQAAGAPKDDQLAKDESSSGETPTRGKSTSNANRGTTAPFLLLASGERAEGSLPTLVIPAQKDIVTLDLELVDDDCAVYSAELRSRSNGVLRSWGNLQARREHSIMRLVSLRFDASLLKNADYLIRLSCATNSANPVFVRDYDFKVEVKPSR
jgi:hypothetical protein